MSRLSVAALSLCTLLACSPASTDCVPTSCAAQQWGCGFALDGCGGTLNCGDCAAGESCGGGGTPLRCGATACVPTTCAALGATCGDLSNGCGDVLHCGQCTGQSVCVASNQCECVPTTCAAAGAGCGTMADGCGGSLQCGSCAAGQTCSANNQCGCVPRTCAAAGAQCGALSDGCGATLDCGTCQAPQTCRGGGVDNQCGCAPSTCESRGASCGQVSDGCGATLNCGACTHPMVCGLDQVCAAPPAARFCEGSFCWENAVPQGRDLIGVSVVGPAEVWALSSSGLALRWNGTSWAQLDPGVAEATAIYAADATHVFVAGTQGQLARFDGTSWTVANPTSAALYALDGTGPNDVWAVGASGTVLHFDGAAWATQTPATTRALYSVDAFAPNAIWASGYGVITYGNGASWSALTSAVISTTRTYKAIHAVAANEAFFGDDAGGFYRAVGTQVTKAAYSAGRPITALWGASAVGLQAVASLTTPATTRLLRFNGSTWSSVTPPAGLFGALRFIDGSATNGWAVGAFGQVARFDGTTWAAMTANAGFGEPTALASATGADLAIFSYDGRGFFTRSAGGGFVNRGNAASNESMAAAWAGSASDVWFVGESTQNSAGVAYHFDGTSMVRHFMPPPTTTLLYGVCGTSASSVWAVGLQGGIKRWNGASWSTFASPTSASLSAAWCDPTGAVFVVGASNTLLRWDGAAFVATAGPAGVNTSYGAVHGSSASDVWAVGSGGIIVHWDGTAWARVPVGTSSAFNAVLVVSPTEVWAGADDGLWKWDGASWARQSIVDPVLTLAGGSTRRWLGLRTGLLAW